MPWIKVQSQLPDEGQIVWMLDEEGFIHLGCVGYDSDGAMWYEVQAPFTYSNELKHIDCTTSDMFYLHVVAWHPFKINRP